MFIAVHGTEISLAGLLRDGSLLIEVAPSGLTAEIFKAYHSGIMNSIRHVYFTGSYPNREVCGGDWNNALRWVRSCGLHIDVELFARFLRKMYKYLNYLVAHLSTLLQ